MKNKYESVDGTAVCLAGSKAEAVGLCGKDVILIEEDCGVKIQIDWGEEPKWWDFSGRAALRRAKERFRLMEEAL